jgi:hypothetical protein
LVINTAGFILQSVSNNLDNNLLNKNIFKKLLEPATIIKVVDRAVKMLELEAEHLGVSILIDIDSNQVQDDLLIDRLRVQ